MILGGRESEWSDEAEFTTEIKKCCRWKDFPYGVDEKRRCSIDENNSRIATKIYGIKFSTIISNLTLPTNTVTSWSVKILETSNNGNEIYIGVAPFDINQNDDANRIMCGWYFGCYASTLWSGPPHRYMNKEYGPRKEKGEYVHRGDSVGVVMDTAKGDLSFALNGANFGVAYEGIPLDKPLVSCVLLYFEGDSVELCEYELSERVNRSISTPSNITAKSIAWDSITLTWNAVDRASFYHVEVDESKFWSSSTNVFIKKGLLPDTEHTFRIRAVKENSVSKWSDAVKGRTQKESFKTSEWKECPEYVHKEMEYSVDEENPRIATKIDDGYGYCTIIWNTPLPLNKVTSWSIKVLKSNRNDGDRIFIGVAPSDINQNVNNNYIKCGWYFGCYASALCSGPPHNYRGKEYRPKKRDGEYVHTGDIVGIVMDTAKGELSFALKGANRGVAYEGIPLNKPLVPCVILGHKGDSVELITSGEANNEDGSCVIS